MRKPLPLLFLFIIFFPWTLAAQDSLMSMLQEEEKPTTEFVKATFKTTRVVIGQSIENPAKGNILFIVTHHFGAMNGGYEQLFGLKQSTVRIGGEYGLTKHLAFGAGINTDRNTWDGFLKYKILRQTKGKRKMPLSLSAFASTAVYTTKWENPERKNYFSSRMSYAFQLIIARKFSERISLQIMPSMVHINLVPSESDQNDIFTLGGGGRIKITKRLSVNAEYHYLFPGQFKSDKIYSSLSIGIDIETGGHVFQIFCTNSLPENEPGFLTNTRGRWSKGDIFLGFNITRVFTVAKNNE